MVRSGRWQRPAKGVVVRHSGPLSHDDRVWCELLVQGPRAALAGLTAASFDGLTGFSSAAIFVAVPRGGRPRQREGVVVRTSQWLGDRDVHPVRTPRRTRLPRSIIDASSWAATDLRAQAILAASVQQGLVSAQSLAEIVHERVNVARRQLIVETIRDVGGGSLSEYELLFMRMCRQFHLPTPPGSDGAETPASGGDTSMSISTSTPCRSRSTVSSTWKRSLGGRTCSETTTSWWRTADGCCGSPGSHCDGRPPTLLGS